MKAPTITTGRLTLRQYEERDIYAWQRWDVDPAVQEFLPEPVNEPQSEEGQRTYLRICLTEEDAVYWSGVWSETDDLIGSISLHEINAYHGTAELSIVIGEKAFCGKGVATEAIRAAVGCAFGALALRRLVAEFETDNVGMQQALSANGFLEECRCHAARIKRGHPVDTYRYFLLAPRAAE